MREQKIVEELYHSTQYVRLDHLAKLFQVTTRSITTDIRYLNEISKRHGFEIILKRKEGYYLKILDKELLETYLSVDTMDDQMNINDRVESIIAMLLLERNFLVQDNIADELQVSKSIIKSDMKKVEQEVRLYNLAIIKKAHFGIKIEGNQMDRKLQLVQLYKKENPYVRQCVDEITTKESIRKLEKQFIVLLKQYGLVTNYIELKEIDIFLRVTLYFCSRKLEDPSSCIVLQSSYNQISEQLKALIEDLCDVSMSDQDVLDMSEYLKQKTKPNQTQLVYDQELKQEIDKFLIMTDIEYHTKFNEDHEFKKYLLAHVSLLIDRLHQSISFSNPLVKEISVKYSVVFDISIKFAKMLEDKYHVKATQDEIGFIATHLAAHMEKEKTSKMNMFVRIAIICSSGGGSAFLIKLKLETLFPTSLIESYSMLDIEDVKKFKPDIIFTITELDEPFDVPIVLIKELLDDTDIQKIKNMFEFQEASTLYETQDDFSALCRKDGFHIFTKGSYHEMIRIMAKGIEEHGYSDVGYCDLVMKREEVLSTVYDHGVAIPHPIDMNANENVLAVGIVKHDVTYEHKDVELIFLVCLKKGDLLIHQNITRVLFQVMSDPSFVKRIRNVDSYEDYMKCIANVTA